MKIENLLTVGFIFGAFRLDADELIRNARKQNILYLPFNLVTPNLKVRKPVLSKTAFRVRCSRLRTSQMSLANCTYTGSLRISFRPGYVVGLGFDTGRKCGRDRVEPLPKVCLECFGRFYHGQGFVLVSNRRKKLYFLFCKWNSLKKIAS